MKTPMQSKSRFRKSGMALSAATLAVGAAALTSASAQSAIQYSGVQNISVSMAGSLDTKTNINLDFYGPPEFSLSGISDLKINGVPVGWMTPGLADLKYYPQIVGESLSVADGKVYKLPAGTMIDSSSSFMNSTNDFFVSSDGSGPWGTNETAYFGFTFTPATAPLYGWGRMTCNGSELTLVDWAYNATGAPISVGDTGLSPAKPTITSLAFGPGNMVTMFFMCSDNSPPSSFTLETTAVLGTLAYWAPDGSATISYSAPSIYEVVTSNLVYSAQFYRIRH
jgi:hypothetical protein